MKVKRSLMITALVLFAINVLATILSGFSGVVVQVQQMGIANIQFLWAVFNATVGVVAAVLLLAASILALRDKGDMVAASALFLCAVQNFLSFVPNWRYVVGSIGSPLQFLSLVGIDWIVGMAYVAIAIVALLKWKGKLAGVIGACAVLGVRLFAMGRAVYYFLVAGVPLGQILPGFLVNFVFCILCLQVGILLYVAAQNKKTA